MFALSEAENQDVVAWKERLEDTVDWLDLKRLMFKISDNESDTEAGHMCSGKVLWGVHLENLFKQNYIEEGFYSG
jgi:hypothetical protein